MHSLIILFLWLEMASVPIPCYKECLHKKNPFHRCSSTAAQQCATPHPQTRVSRRATGKVSYFSAPSLVISLVLLSGKPHKPI